MTSGLTAAGWTFLVVAWTAIGTLTVFCFWRVLGSQQEQD